MNSQAFNLEKKRRMIYMNRKIITCLALSIFMSLNIACSSNSEGTEDASFKETTITLMEESMPAIYGSWYSDAGTLWVLKPNDTYYFYKSKDDLADNYYRGPMIMLNAERAMDKVGYDQEEFDRTLGKYCGLKGNIYSVNFMSSMLHSSGIDKPYEKEELLFQYVFMISKDSRDKATVVDVSLGNVYEVQRLKEY